MFFYIFFTYPAFSLILKGLYSSFILNYNPLDQLCFFITASNNWGNMNYELKSTHIKTKQKKHLIISNTFLSLCQHKLQK